MIDRWVIGHEHADEKLVLAMHREARLGVPVGIIYELVAVDIRVFIRSEYWGVTCKTCRKTSEETSRHRRLFHDPFIRSFILSNRIEESIIIASLNNDFEK